MSSEGKVIEGNSRSEGDDNDEENVITLNEFIEEEQRLEKDADALLGPSDLKNCTYSQGYMKRQALYSCRTCRGTDGKVAGVCVACSYHCHEGHDLVELYTKRHFRCDCGNKRFSEKKCSLEPVKDDENAGNSYNQNFDGLYCTCHRPYPDPEDTVSDAMIQCSVCEDWFHTRHVTSNMPHEDQYGEMICWSCTERLHFLQNYSGYAVSKVVQENGISIEGNSRSAESGESSISNDKEKVKGSDEEKPVIVEDTPTSSLDNSTCDIKLNGEVSVANKTNKEDNSECSLKSSNPIPWMKKEATFWPNNFRKLLCSCKNCKELYSKLNVPWMIDETDTVSWYENKDKPSNDVSEASDASKMPNMDQILKALSSAGVDRFRQAEAILNYNEMKSHLVKYLSKFAENKKVVREEDIHEFFTQMKAMKKQKTQSSYTCR